MPSKNSVKIYVKDSYYHVYNRGVEKRQIFLNSHDYNTFLFYLKHYLSPKDSKENYRIRKNFYGGITLYSYCLMPNHFHLLIKQTDERIMTEFVRALSTSYSLYFNKKYNRVGSLFQGKYKATLVDNDEYLLGLTHYIHRNPIGLARSDLAAYKYSSYQDYLQGKNLTWLDTEFILSFFSKTNPLLSYKSFVEEGDKDTIPQELMLDGD